jgi:hypothetical protein
MARADLLQLLLDWLVLMPARALAFIAIVRLIARSRRNKYLVLGYSRY